MEPIKAKQMQIVFTMEDLSIDRMEYSASKYQAEDLFMELCNRFADSTLPIKYNLYLKAVNNNYLLK